MNIFFNIPKIEPGKKGSNQYQIKSRRILGLKRGTWLTILFILLVLFILGTPMYLAEHYNRALHRFAVNNKVYAQTTVREYKAPVLADESTQDQMIRVIKKVWRRDWETGVAIAKCESGLRPNAFNGSNKNGTWDAGLFQVNTIHNISKEDLMNPYANAGYAYAIYKEQGVQPWYSSNKCHGLLSK